MNEPNPFLMIAFISESVIFNDCSLCAEMKKLLWVQKVQKIVVKNKNKLQQCLGAL
jgi:hypothetical protein